jgi:hypothetical protein
VREAIGSKTKVPVTDEQKNELRGILKAPLDAGEENLFLKSLGRIVEPKDSEPLSTLDMILKKTGS